MNRIEMLKLRLRNYPGAHEGEKWKLEKDLKKCTAREKEKMKTLGVTPEQLMAEGLNRGQVAHILYGYRHTKEA